jgi:O-antigen/teichoic acid export membrane protein
VIFAAKILSIATGLIFTLLLTRNTTEAELGIWSNISDLVAYFAILASAFPFWTTRFVARGKEGATKTGVVANLLVAAISAVVYVPMIIIVTSALQVDSKYLILYIIATLQIINLHMINALEASLRAKRPQAVGYGLIVEEFCKIALAYILVVEFQQPLLGVMIGLVLAPLFQSIYYVKLLSDDLKGKVQWTYVKEWLKGSIINVYQSIGNQAAAFIFIILFSIGGEAARGDYQAAATIANIVAYSSFLSFALYPKLLAEKNIKDVTSSLKLVLMFAIPMTVGIIAIPDSYLIILNEKYAATAIVLMLLAFDMFIYTISQFYMYVLLGVERMDEEAKIPLKQLVKSDIFKVFTLPYVHALIVLPLSIYFLTNFAYNDPILSAAYVTILNMVARTGMFAIMYAILRRKARPEVPWISIGKYMFASAVMFFLLYFLPHPTRIILTLAITVAGAMLYLGLLILIDKEAKELVTATLHEITTSIKMRF